MERWEDIPGFEGLYKISNCGNVKSLYTNETRILKQRPDKNGYMIVDLHHQGTKKTCKVHRLVAIAFIPNPEKHLEINHKDEIKTNNAAENLEWCDRRYNNTYGTARIRTGNMKRGRPNYGAMKAVVCKETQKVYISSKDAALDTGCTVQGICDCLKGRQKKTRGLSFEYKT